MCRRTGGEKRTLLQQSTTNMIAKKKGRGNGRQDESPRAGIRHRPPARPIAHTADMPHIKSPGRGPSTQSRRGSGCRHWGAVSKGASLIGT